MRSAAVQIFDGADLPLRRERVDFPDKLSCGEVLVEISLATICGSDLHTIHGHRTEPTPCVLGHEAVGRVAELGTGRPELTVGDRITWSIADSCGECLFCTRYNLPEKCVSVFKYGHAPLSDGSGLNGCYASHIVLRDGTTAVKIPEGLPDEVAAPANCALATVVNAVSRLPDSAETAVIQGAGMLGLYACAYLRDSGLSSVFCIDVNESRLNLVKEFGGIPVDGTRLEGGMKDAGFPAHGVDAVFEMAGVAALFSQGLDVLRTGGYYCLLGMVHPDSDLNVTGEQLIRKCVTVQGVHNYSPGHLKMGIEFLDRTHLIFPYHRLVSPPIPLHDLPRAIEQADSRAYCRVSVTP